MVSTNIAETSLTLDGVMYVVNTGYCKLERVQPADGDERAAGVPVLAGGGESTQRTCGAHGAGYVLPSVHGDGVQARDASHDDA